ncbi:MAG: aminodeoxychorismate/anthranilate synthase component II [archaeon]|nr:aminodeoxychorismate/anthranilate synthase component II [archaeon]
MIVLIDNYDSFSYNLYQMLGSINPDIKVIRNDAMTPEEIDALNPEAIIISPGPGRPEDAGVCPEVIRKLGSKYPLLGVCLGHQAICQVFGATITYARHLMHGKQSIITMEDDPLFRNVNTGAPVARYHSLAADPDTIPACLKVIATADDGDIMAVRHSEHMIYGLQFHPESIMTPDGRQMLQNFLDLAAARRRKDQ